MLLYAITDRRAYGSDEPTRRAALLRQAERWFAARLPFVQLREKDLPLDDLQSLTRALVLASKRLSASRILVNGPSSLAYRAGADGVHLVGTAHASLPERIAAARQAWSSGEPFISVACHTPDEAAAARLAGASLVVFAPVFEKPLRYEPVALLKGPEPEVPSLGPAREITSLGPASETPGSSLKPAIASLPGSGLSLLADACRAAAPVPTVALGGIHSGNAALCLAAGAAGVAGIRLFAQDDWLSLLGDRRRRPV